MQPNTPMRLEDECGLENATRHNRIRLTRCPVCNTPAPVKGGGVAWKWLSVHIAEHLGYMFDAKEGWLKI